jgi:ArsR family transcriptional regulator
MLDDRFLESTEQEAILYAAFADPTRLRILKLLGNAGSCCSLCVNALSQILDVTQPAISQHLRILKSLDLVKSVRHGYFIHYSINPQMIDKCQQLINSLSELAKENPEIYENENCKRSQTNASS